MRFLWSRFVSRVLASRVSSYGGYELNPYARSGLLLPCPSGAMLCLPVRSKSDVGELIPGAYRLASLAVQNRTPEMLGGLLNGAV